MLSTIEKVLFLKSVDLFSQIPGEELAQIAEVVREVNFAKGEVIISQGDIGDRLYLIIDGKVKVMVDGRQVAELGERECFGEMSILDAEPRSASVIAESDVVLLELSQEDFYQMINERPEIAQGIIKVLTHRLREANRIISELKAKRR